MWDRSPYRHARQGAKKAATGRDLSYRSAIREALETAMRADRRVILIGEGIDDPGAVFGTTSGLVQRFGRRRVIDTPICENALTGIAIGSALAGLRPVLIHMRADFLLISMDQIVNHAAKWSYMFGGKVKVPVVIRAIIGGGWGSAAQHSQALQALFAHTPGLKVVMPSTAYNAKGLFLDALAGYSPVIFLEHRWLYDQRCHVPRGSYRFPIGKAAVARRGKDITLIADSFMTLMALECAETLSREGIEADVVDLLSVKPLDADAVLRSVRKTGRALVLDFGNVFCGVSAEVSALIAEHAFGSLKAPLKRLGLPDVPTPASPLLEKEYYPTKAAILDAVRSLVKERKADV